jgi:hypothetical protein
MYVVTSGASSYGVRAHTSGLGGYGVVASTDGNFSKGMVAATHGTYSEGVVAATYGDYSEGVVTSTTGARSHGVDVITRGVVSHGVDAFTYGIWSRGVNVSTTGQQSEGVSATTTGPYSIGVSATTKGTGSYGVVASTTGDGSYGVVASTSGNDSRGVYAYSQKFDGIYTQTGRTDNKWGLWTPNYIYAKGTQYPATDVAEYMPVVENATPGTVLIIGDDGRLAPATTAYDTRVAGIISTDPGIFLGTKGDGNPGEALIAIAGRVPCKVDATHAPIHAGVLLTTSSNPGYAMKAEPTMINGRGFYPDGTILGKAMGSLESGTGTIEVLVTLQ